MDDALMIEAMERAFIECGKAPAPEWIMVSREAIGIDIVSRSQSHHRKVRRERLSRCAKGMHAWSPLFSICMGCKITRQEFWNAAP